MPFLTAVAISFRSSAMRRSRMIFVASDKSLGGGEAVVSGGLGVTVLEKATGTSPYYLFSSYYSLWVNCGSPGE